jgi:hypothetical protein
MRHTARDNFAGVSVAQSVDALVTVDYADDSITVSALRTR